MVGSFSYATVSAQLNGLPLRTPTHERNGIKAVRQHDQGDRAKYIGVNRVVKGRGLESVCVLLQPHKNPTRESAVLRPLANTSAGIAFVRAARAAIKASPTAMIPGAS